MRLLATLLALLITALLGAWLWRVLATDPGLVIVALRGYSIETSLVVAVPALLILVGLLVWLARLLRYPFRLWRRQRRKSSRNRLAAGLVALHEGRWQRAQRLLERAAADSQQRLPALLAAARAAQHRGDERAAGVLLERAARGNGATADLLAARLLEQRGDLAGIAALFDARPADELPPRALALYVDALEATQRAGDALPLLPALRASRVLEGEALEQREQHVAAAALRQVTNAEDLSRLWKGLPRALRRAPVVVAAYARRSAQLGSPKAGAEALLKVLRRQWSPLLVEAFGHLPRLPRASSLRTAEAWLQEHPGDPVLLVTLGRLCREEQIWGKAEAYLRQALEAGAGAEAWEELGHVLAAQHKDAPAREAFTRALAAQRGDAVELPGAPSLRERIVDRAETEVRSSMGVPRLEHHEDEDNELE